MALVEHLTEVRTRLIICVVAVAIGMVIAFIVYDWIIDFLIRPYRAIATDENSLTGGDLLLTDPLEGFGVRMKTSAYAGIGIAMPVNLWQPWRFVRPGLYSNEKRYVVPFVASALVLFVMGAGLAYYTLPRALGFLVDIGGGGFVTAFSSGRYFTLSTTAKRAAPRSPPRTSSPTPRHTPTATNPTSTTILDPAAVAVHHHDANADGRDVAPCHWRSSGPIKLASDTQSIDVDWSTHGPRTGDLGR